VLRRRLLEADREREQGSQEHQARIADLEKCVHTDTYVFQSRGCVYVCMYVPI
jgi:hypothetical protein